MITVDREDVGEFLDEAQKYHKTAVNGFRNRPEIFNDEIIYNLLALAIEKYFMAFLIKNESMADNHTFTDLINSYERIKPFPQELSYRLVELEKLQNLCPVVQAFSVEKLSTEQINEMIEVTGLVCAELGFSDPLISCHKD